jgi:hypothetical protein
MLQWALCSDQLVKFSEKLPILTKNASIQFD